MSLLVVWLRTSLIVVIGCIATQAYAQRNAYWIEGKVTFKNGHTQYCMLNYDATVSEGLLQIREGEKLLTYTVKDVERFSFFDDNAGQWRRFYSIPFYLTQGKVTREFFMELVYSGEQWSILRKKERWVGPYTYQVLSPESYVLQRAEKKIKYARFYEQSYLLDMETGAVEELTKDTLLESVRDQKPAMKAFIKEHRLRFHAVEDFVDLLNYYHQLLTTLENASGAMVTPTK